MCCFFLISDYVICYLQFSVAECVSCYQGVKWGPLKFARVFPSWTSLHSRRIQARLLFITIQYICPLSHSDQQTSNYLYVSLQTLISISLQLLQHSATSLLFYFETRHFIILWSNKLVILLYWFILSLSPFMSQLIHFSWALRQQLQRQLVLKLRLLRDFGLS